MLDWPRRIDRVRCNRHPGDVRFRDVLAAALAEVAEANDPVNQAAIYFHRRAAHILAAMRMAELTDAEIYVAVDAMLLEADHQRALTFRALLNTLNHRWGLEK
jgi:hypothetical protein